MGKYIHKATTHLDDSQQAAKEFIYGAINERDFDGVMRLLQKCYASTNQEYKKKEVTEYCYENGIKDYVEEVADLQSLKIGRAHV